MSGKTVNNKGGNVSPEVNLSQHDGAPIAKSEELRTEDLRARLNFAVGSGRIWLDDQRMILLHLSAFASLRKDLIESLGIDKARQLLTRIGYSAGTQAASLAAKIRPDDLLLDAFTTGPQFHALQGLVSVETVEIRVDIDKGTYFCEQIWHDSSEDDAHISEFGIGSEPMCWMQLGFASGYNSTFFGRPIIFREVQCRSMGNAYCRIIGKLAEEWDDSEEGVRFFQPEPFMNVGILADHKDRASEAGGIDTLQDDLYEGLVGVSSSFVSACHKLQKVAGTNATVLVLGETGVGKERFAQMLHRIGKRKAGPFIAVNCAAIPESLLESELFGVERGAYTGAHQSRLGRFERAEGGTLFLDEIGTLNEVGQAKLLRALQEREIERVGDIKTRPVNVRVVAATNDDLEQLVRDGRFRADLYYRLNVFPIILPPLRERRDDIPLLAQHFLVKYARLHEKNVAGLSYKALSTLMSYDFPGNVRELENIIERGVILAADGELIDRPHLSLNEAARFEDTFQIDKSGHMQRARNAAVDAISPQGEGGGLESLASQALDALFPLDKIESSVMQEAVRRSNGNLAASARMLGISRAQLEYRLKKRTDSPADI